MKKTNQVIWGIVLIGIGTVWALNAFGLTDIDLFFDGWWTLFIIIPSIVGLFSNHDKTGNIIGLCIGVFLLLCCQDIMDFGMIWKLAIPVIIVIFGIKMIVGSLWNANSIENLKQIQTESGNVVSKATVFSGETLDFSGEVFQGAQLNAVFGGLKCDLRRAQIDQDCLIDASAIFGGVDIYVPTNVNVKVSSNSVFGGVTNKAPCFHDENAPTIYIKGNCMFGGVDVK